MAALQLTHTFFSLIVTSMQRAKLHLRVKGICIAVVHGCIRKCAKESMKLSVLGSEHRCVSGHVSGLGYVSSV